MDCRIEVFDVSDASLEIAKNRFNEAYNTKTSNIKIVYSKNMNSMSKNVDLLILSTSSKGREQIIKDVCMKSNIKNIILEKVIFQDPDSYERVNHFFQEKGINCWVNCWPRTIPIFKTIKNKIKEFDNFELHVSGNHWGLGSNSLHYLDLLNFFSNGAELIKIESVISEIYEAKRKGYYDFIGKISAENINGNSISLNAAKGKEGYITINLISGRNLFKVVDQISEMKVIEQNEGEKTINIEQFPFQSQRTHLIARDILAKNICELPCYDKTYHIHKKFIKSLLLTLNRDHQKEYHLCPIT